MKTVLITGAYRGLGDFRAGPRSIPALLLAAAIFFLACRASQSGEGVISPALDAGTTNSFPALAEIFQGRTFENEFERDVFFLRSVRDRYPQYWNPPWLLILR